jgi:hypothetical protein
MPRRRKHSDHRHHFDAPFLPCIRDYRMGDGSRKSEVDPEYESRYREHLMQTTPHPTWKSDPTYHMKWKPK